MKPASPHNRKTPSPADIAIGAAIRARRNLCGLSQTALAEAIGLTFQQVQKYEKGTNRVGGGRLVAIAAALGTRPQHLMAAAGDSDQAESAGAVDAALATRDGARLVAAFASVTDPDTRRAIADLVVASVGMQTARGRTADPRQMDIEEALA